jgi:hypothetical protein
MVYHYYFVRIAAGNFFHYQQNSGRQLIGLLQSVIFSESPMKWISHIFWLKPLKLVFSNLKRKIPINFKRKCQKFNAKRRPFD